MAGAGAGVIEGRSHGSHARGPVAGRGAGKRRSVGTSPESDQGATCVGARLIGCRRVRTWRPDLEPGAVIPGPAIVAEDETSTLVTRRLTVRVAANRYLVIARR